MYNDIIYRQSGVVPFFIENGGIKYILITSMKGNWIFPKGLVEDHLTSPESALKEAEEEAGVMGDIFPGFIASYEQEKWGGVCRIDMYLLKVTEMRDSWDEDMCRRRKICSFIKATRIIHNRVRGILFKADKWLHEHESKILK